MLREFNLIDRSIHYYNNALLHYNKIDKDTMKEDYEIRDCCMMLQYCTEMLIKGFIEHLCGCDYEYKHEFDGNINILRANKNNIPKWEELSLLLDILDANSLMIKDWHTSTVYKSGFRTTINKINTVIDLDKGLINYWNSIKPDKDLSATKEINDL